MTSLYLNTSHIPEDLLKRAKNIYPKAVDMLVSLHEKTCKGSEWLGWFGPHWHGSSFVVEETQKAMSKLSVYYDSVVVCGIGGSFAGAKAVYDLFAHSLKPVFFLGCHLSEASTFETLDQLSHKKPLVLIISKSGTTTEPALAFRVLRQFLEETFPLDWKDRLWIITDAQKGALRQFGDTLSCVSFSVPDDVGGRYSILTAVGLVPLVLAGFDPQGLLLGAHNFFQELSENSHDHSCLMLASLRHGAWESGLKMHSFSYQEPKLGAFVEWWKQLCGESEGKAGKGLFPIGLSYSADLHSLGQYLQEGPVQIFQMFVTSDEPLKQDSSYTQRCLMVPHGTMDDGMDLFTGKSFHQVNQSALISALLAHSERGVPCVELRIPKWEPYVLGQLFAYLMTNSAITALLLGVNPFDQPGVEAYKKKLFSGFTL